MLTRILLVVVALSWMSCSSTPWEGGPSAAEDEIRIRRILAGIDAQWFADPEEPVARLAAFGRDRLPFLKQNLPGASPSAGLALRKAIERVYCTDAFYLVRAPDRRVTVGLKSAMLAEAYQEIFISFPMRPRPERPREGGPPATRVTVWLNDASYWEVVRGFCGAFDVEWRDQVLEHGQASSWSRPHGECIVSASGKEGRLTVQIHLDPETQPIDGSIHSLAVTDSKGRNLEDRVTVQPEAEGESFMRVTGDRQRTQVGKTEIRWRDGPGDARGPFTVAGRARVILATEIESVSWTADDWNQEPVRELRPWQLDLKSFDPFDLRYTSADASARAGTGDYRRHAWVFLSDDEGRSVHASGFTVGEGGAIAAAGWTYDTPCRRLTVIRPVAMEVVEFPFEIRGIRRLN